MSKKIYQELDKQIISILDAYVYRHPWADGLGGDRAWRFVGSQITVYPPPEGDTDLDILVPDDATLINSLIDQAGFVPDSNPNYGELGEFTSYRKGKINIIVAHDENFYRKFLLATEVCKALNLPEKTDRVLVHTAIMQGRDSRSGLDYNPMQKASWEGPKRNALEEPVAMQIRDRFGIDRAIGLAADVEG